jgi:hypothetical protein
VHLLRIARALAQLRTVVTAVADQTASLAPDLAEAQRTFAVSADDLRAARLRIVGDEERAGAQPEARPLTNVAPRTVR